MDISPIRAQSAQVRLRNVELRSDTVVDELDLDGAVSVEPGAAAGAVRVDAGEVKIRAMMTEPNLNRLLVSSLPSSAPVRNLKLAVLTGKVRVTGDFVRFGLALPFTAEAVIHIENGVRMWPEWKSMSAAGVGLPAAAVDAIEQHLNRSLVLDLTRLPAPATIDEVKCEPGRVTATGRARVSYPPAALPAPVLPFSAPYTATIDAASTPPLPPSLPPSGEVES